MQEERHLKDAHSKRILSSSDWWFLI